MTSISLVGIVDNRDVIINFANQIRGIIEEKMGSYYETYADAPGSRMSEITILNKYELMPDHFVQVTDIDDGIIGITCGGYFLDAVNSFLEKNGLDKYEYLGGFERDENGKLLHCPYITHCFTIYGIKAEHMFSPGELASLKTYKLLHDFNVLGYGSL